MFSAQARNPGVLQAGAEMSEPGAMAWAVVAGAIVGALAVVKLVPVVISVIAALLGGGEDGES